MTWETPTSMNVPQADSGVDAKRIEKQSRWDQNLKEIDRIIDGLGLGVDNGIKETLAALMAYEVPTISSCEGHIDEEHGEPYPWVDVSAPEPEGWINDESKQQEWTKENLILQQKINQLLSEFYQVNAVAPNEQIILQPKGIFGAFRLQGQEAEGIKNLAPEQQKERLEANRKVMESFAEFLKAKYFAE